MLCIFISIGGTIVMRKFQTGFAIGIFLGVVVVMANQCLMMVAIFGEMSKDKDEDKGSKKSADDAAAVFAFFLFVVYALFASLLAVFRPERPASQRNPVRSRLATTSHCRRKRSHQGGLRLLQGRRRRRARRAPRRAPPCGGLVGGPNPGPRHSLSPRKLPGRDSPPSVVSPRRASSGPRAP